MEAALVERDKVGVQDFVLLNDHLSLDEFIANLEKRFKHDLIYVSKWMFFFKLTDISVCVSSMF